MAESGDVKRKRAEELFRSLSSDERRSRLIFAPGFRDLYNEITEAHRIVPVPHYFWKKWVPRLGPLVAMLYMKLRQHVFVNRETGERREVCWPKQDTLAREIGSNRKSVLKALKELEELGFLTSKPTRFNDPETGFVRTGTKRYTIFFEVPLVEEDAVELLVREMEQVAGEGVQPGAPIRMSQKGTHGPTPVDNSHRKSQKGTHLAVPKRDSNVSTRTSTLRTLTNVDTIGSEVRDPKLHVKPSVAAVSRETKERGDALALEVGDTLHRLAGNGTTEVHRSAGFHRRICRILPEVVIRQALAATRDAMDRQRAGEGRVSAGPAAYFAGAVKNLAAEHGIDLGLEKRSRPSPQPPLESPKRPVVPRKPLETTQEPDGPRMSPEDARVALRELVEKLAHKT